MQISNFEDMCVAELQELLSMEGQLAEALGRMAEVASYPSLKNAVIASSGRNAGPKAKTRINLAEAWRERMGSHRPSHADAGDRNRKDGLNAEQP